MTLVETLFGGLLLIIGMHLLLRLAKLGSYWRGVLSGLFPIVGYMVLATRQWPGGDVVAMHITIFLAAATVMTIISNDKPGASAKLHWAPMLMVAFFSVLAVLMATFLVIAVRGIPTKLAQVVMPNAENRIVHTAFSGVVEHDEQAAKSINQHLSAQNRQRKLGWHVDVSGLESVARSRMVAISVKVRNNESKPLQNAQVKVSVQPFANIEGMRDVTLNETEPGTYSGQVEFSQPGRWVVTLQIEHGKDEYQVEHSVNVPKA